ncbi:hypothetical protein BDP27DRAFT_1366362 [Rhodocollybia butyracea]|uniref:Uncharacterized protein n=1 Tax=Rhodocollybia butyracea TaxID=206335 RepID=A0A9P5PLI6_9AGAR|nr:hypothetical protein BDP27DRAFT_1366362 [Rhodocollybia butyracea]
MTGCNTPQGSVHSESSRVGQVKSEAVIKAEDKCMESTESEYGYTFKLLSVCHPLPPAFHRSHYVVAKLYARWFLVNYANKYERVNYQPTNGTPVMLAHLYIRGDPWPTGGNLRLADGTAWKVFRTDKNVLT